MRSPRTTAVVAGVFYLITHVTSVIGALLYASVLSDPDYILGAGGEGGLLFAALLELLLALSVVGTAVTLFPVVRRQNEGFAIGYVALRTLEAATILTGAVTLVAIATLRTSLGGASTADAASLTAIGHTLVAFNSASFLIGQGLVVGVNTVLLAYLMFRSHLVPRYIGVLGLIGGPLVFFSNLGLMFGLYDQVSPIAGIAVIPVFAWEISLALTMIIVGFKPAALARLRMRSHVTAPPAVGA